MRPEARRQYEAAEATERQQNRQYETAEATKRQKNRQSEAAEAAKGIGVIVAIGVSGAIIVTGCHKSSNGNRSRQYEAAEAAERQHNRQYEAAEATADESAI